MKHIIKSSQVRYIVAGLVAASATVVIGTSSETEAGSRRLNPSTNCVNITPGSNPYYTNDGSFLSASHSRGLDFLCDIPSDGYLRHNHIKHFNVHATNHGADQNGKPKDLRFRVCITDYKDNFSTVCGRFRDAKIGENRRTKVRDLDVLRRNGREGWFPVLVVEGVTEITSITGYYIAD